MDARHALLVAGAGWVAGVVNTIAGAGSLLTFPALIAGGLSPLTANVSNCIGVVPGSISGAYGLRAELSGQRRLLLRLGVWAAAGSVVGAVVLLTLPSAAFEKVVPVLVGAAGLLVLAQPLVARSARAEGHLSPWTAPVVGVLGIYSGYFGAAIGVLLVGALGVLAPQPLRRTNARKNVIAAAGNATAGAVYAVVAPVNWVAVLLLAVGSATGGPVGAVLAKRVPAGPLRVLIALISLVVAVQLALRAW